LLKKIKFQELQLNSRIP